MFLTPMQSAALLRQFVSTTMPKGDVIRGVRIVAGPTAAKKMTGSMDSQAVLAQGLAMVRRTKAGAVHKQDVGFLALVEAGNAAEVRVIVERRLKARAARLAKAS